MKSVICFFSGHTVVEWEHGDYLPQGAFFPGKAVLRQPYCGRCGDSRSWNRKKSWDEILSTPK